MDRGINKPPIRIPEPLGSPEQKVSNIVKRAEAVVAKQSKMPRTLGSRLNACAFAPDVVDRLTEPLRITDKSMQYKTLQLLDLHKQVGNTYDSAGVTIANGFQHAVSILTIEGEMFLIDLTFCQFMKTDGYISEGIERNGAENTNPIAQELLTKGYFRLTNSSLKEFLRITSRKESKNRALENADLHDIDLTPSLKRDFTNEALDTMIRNVEPNWM